MNTPHEKMFWQFSITAARKKFQTSYNSLPYMQCTVKWEQENTTHCYFWVVKSLRFPIQEKTFTNTRKRYCHNNLYHGVAFFSLIISVIVSGQLRFPNYSCPWDLCALFLALNFTRGFSTNNKTNNHQLILLSILLLTSRIKVESGKDKGDWLLAQETDMRGNSSYLLFTELC